MPIYGNSSLSVESRLPISHFPTDSVGTALDNNTDRWAPDVHKVGNLYYLYYSISTWGTQNSHIGVATSPSLEPGTWTDLGSTGVASRDGSRYNAIDGNLFQDGDGSFLLTFGSFWGNTYQVPLTSPEPTRANANPYNIQFNSTGSQSSEGPYLFKFGEWYYLFWSSGQCCKYDTERPKQGEEYKIMVCRAERASGPFVDMDNTPCTQNGGTQVLGSHDFVYGPGGQGLYHIPNYGPVIYYHYVDTKVGFADGQKRIGINKVDFVTGWPVLVG
ncbi:Arabinan endo-1,5-alpha-L-arabinosidase A [Macrophomina phaseolina]|uniref:arabinan endo-1,5-alpha-L-arabinosidase n=1 Tax=Macrophomina phaseolina TaxID=35725 RepID=A0ABQ8FS21_9PEZI|nr:Arabinan endo-1,5-alpha-L-arabinosidase A [Macrophomina phaseolina]